MVTHFSQVAIVGSKNTVPCAPFQLQNETIVLCAVCACEVPAVRRYKECFGISYEGQICSYIFTDGLVPGIAYCGCAGSYLRRGCLCNDGRWMTQDARTAVEAVKQGLLFAVICCAVCAFSRGAKLTRSDARVRGTQCPKNSMLHVSRGYNTCV